MKYGEGATEPATPQRVKSAGGTASSASRQAGASQKRFAVFDIDGTLIRWQLYHAIADALARKGHIKPESYDAIKTARMDWKRRQHPEAFRAYQMEVVRIYESVIKDLTLDQFEAATKMVFDEYKDQVYTFTRDLVKRLKKQGYLLFAISGSQTEVVRKIADYYEFDDCVGTDYLRKAGRFTGEVRLAVESKDKVLAKLIAKHRASSDGSVAVGDTTSDIAMMQMVARPIAFNPDRQLFKHAKAAGWPVAVERKNMIYHLENSDGRYQLAETK